MLPPKLLYRTARICAIGHSGRLSANFKAVLRHACHCALTIGAVAQESRDWKLELSTAVERGRDSARARLPRLASVNHGNCRVQFPIVPAQPTRGNIGGRCRAIT